MFFDGSNLSRKSHRGLINPEIDTPEISPVPKVLVEEFPILEKATELEPVADESLVPPNVNLVRTSPQPTMLDLFSGTNSVGNVFREMVYCVVSVDHEHRYHADIQEDILTWDYENNFQ